jgi:Cdc6-like AAA superfamily ATPase
MSQSPRNPYRPGAATAPRYLAGRDPQLNRWDKILLAAPEIPANLRLTGLRGVGKSVLLKEMEKNAKSANWVTVRKQLEPRHNTESELTTLIRGLAAASERSLSTARKLRGHVESLVEAGRHLLQVSYEDHVQPCGGGE